MMKNTKNPQFSKWNGKKYDFFTKMFDNEVVPTYVIENGMKLLQFSA